MENIYQKPPGFLWSENGYFWAL